MGVLEVGRDNVRIVSAILVALVLWESDLVDAVDVGSVIHGLAEIVVEFGSGEPVSGVVVGGL